MEDPKDGRLSSSEETSDDREDVVPSAEEPRSEMKVGGWCRVVCVDNFGGRF